MSTHGDGTPLDVSPVAGEADRPGTAGTLRLTPIVQEQAIARLRRLYQLNPIGSNLMMGPVLFLIALEYGASDLAISILYAGPWLAGVVAVLAPLLCSRIDPARITAQAWIMRAICGLFYVLLPFLFLSQAKVLLLVACFLGFSLARMLGIIALNVVTASYVDQARRPAVIAYAHVWYNTGVLGSTVLSTAVLGWHSGEWGFVAVLTLGVLATFAAVVPLKGFPLVGTRQETLRPLPWSEPGVREALRTTALVVPQAVAAAYQFSALKSIYDVDTGMIFLLTVLGLALAIAATHVLSRVLPVIGLKRVQIGVHAALALVGLLWAFAGVWPETLRVGCCLVLYVLAQPLLAMSLALMSAIQVDRLPRRNVVGASALIQGVSAASGGLGVVVIWGTGHLPVAAVPGAGPYAHAFLLWAACSLGICLLGLIAGRAPTMGELAAVERE
ncbi:MAG TPA: MFS transporter [Planctomycetota bacterium]|nr:MFS transporter [Planctomycetota bacterium]